MKFQIKSVPVSNAVGPTGFNKHFNQLPLTFLVEVINWDEGFKIPRYVAAGYGGDCETIVMFDNNVPPQEVQDAFSSTQRGEVFSVDF